jgi:hypothetical protein
VTVAPGSILTWLAIREVLKKRNVKSSTLLDAGCGDAWMTTKLIRSGLASGGSHSSHHTLRTAGHTNSLLPAVQSLAVTVQH